MTKTEINKLDRIWKQKVFENAIWRCELSGLTPAVAQLHPHHYVGRRNRATRWYLPNGICLSASMHTMGVKSAHGDPEYFRKIILDIRGQLWLNDLVKQSNKVCKSSYQTVLDYFEGKTDNYC